VSDGMGGMPVTEQAELSAWARVRRNWQAAERPALGRGFWNMTHLWLSVGGGDDARDGRDGRIAVRSVDLAEHVPQRHPMRRIRQVVNDALSGLDAQFECLHADFDRPSIAPDRLIRASLIRILFGVRSGCPQCSPRTATG